MRYLTRNYIESTLNRGKAIEQFLGEITRDGIDGLRFIQIHKKSSSYDLAVSDIEDAGSPEYVDVYSFPTLVEDEYYDKPTFSFNSLDEALSQSARVYKASEEHWVSEGVVQDEYLDFLFKNDKPNKTLHTNP